LSERSGIESLFKQKIYKYIENGLSERSGIERLMGG